MQLSPPSHVPPSHIRAPLHSAKREAHPLHSQYMYTVCCFVMQTPTPVHGCSSAGCGAQYEVLKIACSRRPCKPVQVHTYSIGRAGIPGHICQEAASHSGPEGVIKEACGGSHSGRHCSSAPNLHVEGASTPSGMKRPNVKSRP